MVCTVHQMQHHKNAAQNGSKSLYEYEYEYENPVRTTQAHSQTGQTADRYSSRQLATTVLVAPSVWLHYIKLKKIATVTEASI
eukprot:scaffold75554_cov17-Prasinocladus_malaysianus.AAC.1